MYLDISQTLGKGETAYFSEGDDSEVYVFFIFKLLLII